MTPSRMQQMTALGADWWNDSCDLDELGEAVARGAVGATSNPVIVSTVLAGAPTTWDPVLDRIIRDHSTWTEDEIAWELVHEVSRRAAPLLLPVFERTKGEQGFLSVQVSSKLYRNCERMVEQGLFLSSLAPNIAIKAPAVAAGLAAMEELSAQGVRINATVSFSVAQAVAGAEAIERGLARAPRAGADVRPYVTIMIGRVDDHLKRVQERENIKVETACMDWAGIAIFRRAAQVFRARGYRSTLLAAAYRHEGHWREVIGRDVLQTIPYKWWKQYDGAAQDVRLTIDDPVDPACIAELRAKFPDFAAAYDEDGMAPAQFVRYGATLATLQQFLGGYDQLLAMVRRRMLG